VQWNAFICEDVIAENPLQIENDGEATHHGTREGHEGESVSNLTLTNRLLTKWSILAHAHAAGSDHEVIECAVDVDRQEGGHEKVVGWN
jgi:hypothetical protein